MYEEALKEIEERTDDDSEYNQSRRQEDSMMRWKKKEKKAAFIKSNEIMQNVAKQTIERREKGDRENIEKLIL